MVTKAQDKENTGLDLTDLLGLDFVLAERVEGKMVQDPNSSDKNFVLPD